MAQARTAVVVVHGIGNQRPLATVRQIVDALYVHDLRVDGDAETKIWAKLDRAAGDLDLPVITTANLAQADGSTRPVDFHECYWAPLMAELRFLAVPLWLFELVKKGPGAMTPGIQRLWYVVGFLLALWLLAACVLTLHGLSLLTGYVFAKEDSLPAALIPWTMAAALCGALMGSRGLLLFGVLIATLYGLCSGWEIATGQPIGLPMRIGSTQQVLWAAVALLLFVAMNWFFLLTVAGDAARYLRGAPGNIMVRRQIRSMGVDLLRHLHSANWQGQPKYDRIIVVAHSLGTLVAYDMLRAYWSEVAPTLGDPFALADTAAQDSAGAIESDTDRILWRERGHRLLRALDRRMLGQRGCFSEDGARRWIVSDFVSLGSPLTHAVFLMSEGKNASALAASFKLKQQQREFPTCPATTADGDGLLTFSRQGRKRFHHGALFGLTRWSNLFFPVKRVLWGDLVGGPIAQLFGHGIADVPVSGAPKGDWLAHTHYWDSSTKVPPNDALIALRKAVNLRGQAES